MYSSHDELMSAYNIVPNQQNPNQDLDGREAGADLLADDTSLDYVQVPEFSPQSFASLFPTTDDLARSCQEIFLPSPSPLQQPSSVSGESTHHLLESHSDFYAPLSSTMSPSQAALPLDEPQQCPQPENQFSLVQVLLPQSDVDVQQQQPSQFLQQQQAILQPQCQIIVHQGHQIILANPASVLSLAVPQPLFSVVQPQVDVIPMTNLSEDPDEVTISQMDVITKASGGVDLDEIRDLVRAFKEKRVSLGLTQSQVGLDLEASGTGAVPYSQSQICRIERLDITPRQAKQLKPVLQKWLSMADQRYCFLSTTDGSLVPVIYNKFVVGNAFSSACKRRQKRTIFSPETIEALNKKFEETSTPNAYHMGEIAKSLGLDYKTVRIWYCNKRQATKSSSQR